MNLVIRSTLKTKVKRAGLQVVWADQLPKRRYRIGYLSVPERLFGKAGRRHTTQLLQTTNW